MLHVHVSVLVQLHPFTKDAQKPHPSFTLCCMCARRTFEKMWIKHAFASATLAIHHELGSNIKGITACPHSIFVVFLRLSCQIPALYLRMVHNSLFRNYDLDLVVAHAQSSSSLIGHCMTYRVETAFLNILGLNTMSR